MRQRQPEGNELSGHPQEPFLGLADNLSARPRATQKWRNHWGSTCSCWQTLATLPRFSLMNPTVEALI
jgi:hypothetical protein